MRGTVIGVEYAKLKKVKLLPEIMRMMIITTSIVEHLLSVVTRPSGRASLCRICFTTTFYCRFSYYLHFEDEKADTWGLTRPGFNS